MDEANSTVSYPNNKILNLLIDLINLYDIPIENILGHYATASGKRAGKICPNFDMDQVRKFLDWLHE